jgi:hypothetical protein
LSDVAIIAHARHYARAWRDAQGARMANVALQDYLNNQPLNRKMEQLIDLVLAGDPNDPEAGPLDCYTAGKIFGYQRKRVRELFANPNFVAAYEEKKRLFVRDKYLTTMLPGPEHLRDQLRWQKERAGLREEIERPKGELAEAKSEVFALRRAKAAADA